MALIAMPTGGIRSIQWELDQPSQSTRSEWTGKTSVLLQGAARWRAKVEVVPTNEANLMQWIGFMASLRGRVNTFELLATEKRQASVTPSTVTANTGSTGGTLVTTGWGGSTVRQVLPPGAMLSFAGRLYVATAGATTGIGGVNSSASFAVAPNLAAATAGETIKVQAPVGTMRLSGTTMGWSAVPGVWQAGSFDCEESF